MKGRARAGGFSHSTIEVAAGCHFPFKELAARKSWPASVEDVLMIGVVGEARTIRLEGLGPSIEAAVAAGVGLEFDVAGGGRFPLDMLRYSRSWPASARDARRIARAGAGGRRVRLVALAGLGPLAPGRWASFG